MSGSAEASVIPPRLAERVVTAWTLDTIPPLAAPDREPAAYSAPGTDLVDAREALRDALARESAAREAEAAGRLEKIRADAAEQGRKTGFADGHAAGYAEGYEEGQQVGEIAEGLRLRTALQAAERALADLRQAEAKWAGNIEENVIALAVAVARHVLGREVENSAAAFTELVRRALAEFPIDEPIRIRVHPADLAAISTMVGTAGEPIRTAAGRDAAWVADASVVPGGCLVESRDRIIDGRVDAALERIYRRLSYTHA